MTIEQALSIIFRQMEITGRRPRTIESYDYIFNDFTGQLRLEYVDEITADSIYDYLAAIDVAPSTKLIRLKAIKAVLSRFFDNRWKTNKFWSPIQLTVDKHVKQGADENVIEV